MRKQYHSRYAEGRNLIWDVDRLVALSAKFPRINVPISSLRELDEPYWFSGENLAPTCRAVADHARLIADTDLRYPIILAADGRVMDGMHRVAKAYMQGLKSVTAVQFVADPDPDYIDVPIDDLPYDETSP